MLALTHLAVQSFACSLTASSAASVRVIAYPGAGPSWTTARHRHQRAETRRAGDLTLRGAASCRRWHDTRAHVAGAVQPKCLYWGDAAAAHIFGSPGLSQLMPPGGKAAGCCMTMTAAVCAAVVTTATAVA